MALPLSPIFSTLYKIPTILNPKAELRALDPGPQATACLYFQGLRGSAADRNAVGGGSVSICARSPPPLWQPPCTVPPPLPLPPLPRYDLIFLSHSPLPSFGPMSTTGAGSTQCFPSSNPHRYPTAWPLAEAPGILLVGSRGDRRGLSTCPSYFRNLKGCSLPFTFVGS